MKAKSTIVIATIILFYLSISSLEAEELYPVLIDDNMAYINSKAEVIIQTDYSPDIEINVQQVGSNTIEYMEFPNYSQFSEDYALVRDVTSFFGIIDLGTKYYLINSKGDTKLESDVIIDQFRCGYARKNIEIEGLGKIVIGNENNFLDKNLNKFLSENFNYVSYFSDCYALVKRDRFGYIDRSGKVVIECQFEDAGDFKEGLAYAQIDGKYGYIDKKGDVVIEPKFESAFDFNSGAARVYDGNNFFYINTLGEKISYNDYDVAMDFSEGYACVKTNHVYEFIDTKGNKVFEVNSAYPSYFSSGLAAIFTNGRWTYIDKQGRIQFPPVFEFAKAFDRELAMVWYKGNIYYLNKNGELIWSITDQRKSFIDLNLIDD